MVTVNKYTVLFPSCWYLTSLWKLNVTYFLWLTGRYLEGFYIWNFILQCPHLCKSWLSSQEPCFPVVMNIQPNKNERIIENNWKLSAINTDQHLMAAIMWDLGGSSSSAGCKTMFSVQSNAVSHLKLSCGLKRNAYHIGIKQEVIVYLAEASRNRNQAQPRLHKGLVLVLPMTAAAPALFRALPELWSAQGWSCHPCVSIKASHGPGRSDTLRPRQAQLHNSQVKLATAGR